MSVDVNELLVGVGSQKTIDFWSLKKGCLLRSVRTQHKDTITRVLSIPNQNSLITSCRNSVVGVCKFEEDGKPSYSKFDSDPTLGYVVNMCFVEEKDPTLFCTTNSDFTVNLWSLTERKVVKTVSDTHDAYITSLVTDTPKNIIMTSCEDGSIIVWDNDLVQKQKIEDKKTGIISCMCYNPKKEIIAHCGWNNMVFSTLKNGKHSEIQRIKRKDDVIMLCNSPTTNPNYLYSVEQNGYLSYYDYRKITNSPVGTTHAFSKNAFTTRLCSFVTGGGAEPIFLSYTASRSSSFALWDLTKNPSNPLRSIPIPSNSGTYQAFLTIPPESLPSNSYMAKQGDELQKRLSEMREELRMLKSFFSQSENDLRGLEQKLEREKRNSSKARSISEQLQSQLDEKERELLTVHANYMDRMMAQQKEFDERVSRLQHHQEAEEEKRIEGIRKKIEEQKRKELNKRLNRNRGMFKKAENELEDMKKMLERRASGASGGSVSKKKSSSILSLFNSKSDVSTLASGNAFTSAYFVSHGENPIQKKEKELRSLGEEIQRLENVNKILAEPNLVHGKSRSDEFMRNYLGFIVKSVEVRDYTTNEVKFLEELNGNYLDGVQNSFLKEKLTSDQRKYFPQYYGHWIEKGELDEEGSSKPDMYKISIERGKADLRAYVVQHQFSPKTKMHLILESARGLNVLHNNNLIHGDVKPHNFAVFLDHEDKVLVKVIDFENVGVAVRKMDGTMSGSPCYHDPRLYDIQQGDIEVYGKSRDIFSFGCLMWNIFVEETPFIRFLKDVIFAHYHNFFQMRELSLLFNQVVVHEDTDYVDPITNQGFKEFLDKGSSNSKRFSNPTHQAEETEETEGEDDDDGEEKKKKPVKSVPKHTTTSSTSFDPEHVKKVLAEARTEQSLFPILRYGFKDSELRHIPSFIKKLIHECLFFDESIRPQLADIIRKVDKVFERDRISGMSPFSIINRRRKASHKVDDAMIPTTDDSIGKRKASPDNKSSKNNKAVEEEDDDELDEGLLLGGEDDEYGDDDNDDGVYEEVDFSQGGEEDLEPEDELRPPKSGINKQNVKTWGIKQVQEWLKYHYFSDGIGFKKYQEALKVKGKQLVKLKWRRVGFETESHEREMKECVESLSRVGKLDYFGLETVYKKLQVMIVRHSVTTLASIDNLLTLVRNLALPSYMVRTYLNPEIMKSDVDEFLKKEEMRESDAKEKDESFQIDYGPLKEKVDETKEKESFTHLRKKDPKETKFPCKLVLTEIAQTSGQKTIRKLLSPIMSKIPGFHNKYGMFHSALIIGPWLIEWNNSALVIPRKLRSSMAFMSADLNTTATLKNVSLDEMTRKLADVICRWNTRMYYKNVNIKRSKKVGNCQDFVDEVMKELGITLDYSMGTSYANFINKMKQKGEIEFEFLPPKRMKKVFDLKLKAYKFETHLELDNFMKDLKDKNEVELTSEFEEDRLFLKSLDRAYWLRFFRNPEDPRYKPSPAGCFFGDPRLTKSYQV